MVHHATQASRHYTHDRIHTRVEGFRLLEDLKANRVFFEVFSLLEQSLLHAEAQKTAETSRPGKRLRLKHLLELRPERFF